MSTPPKQEVIIDSDTGKSSPSLVGEFDVMAAAAAQKQKAIDLNVSLPDLDLDYMLPDLDNDPKLQGILSGLTPKGIDVNDRSGIDVDRANAYRAKYATPERGEVNSALIANLGNQYFAENPLYDTSFLDFQLDPSIGSSGENPYVYQELSFLGKTTQITAGAGLAGEGLRFGSDAVYLGYMLTKGSNVNYIGEAFNTLPNATLSTNTNKLMNSTKLVGGLNTIGENLGRYAGFAGVALSGLSASDYYLDTNGNGAQQSIYNAKVVVDSAMLFVGTALPPVGIAYGAADLALSFLPDYTAEYGPYKGEVIKGGWHNFHQREVDRTVEQLNSGVDPFQPISPYNWGF